MLSKTQLTKNQLGFKYAFQKLSLLAACMCQLAIGRAHTSIGTTFLALNYLYLRLTYPLLRIRFGIWGRNSRKTSELVFVRHLAIGTQQGPCLHQDNFHGCKLFVLFEIDISAVVTLLYTFEWVSEKLLLLSCHSCDL